MKKFFFDLHDFSDPNAAEEIEEELPPPVFNEEQLEAARREAHALGRQAGLDEAAASREQLVANMLRNISESFSKLFASEHIREKQFEQESVKLALEMLEKLFPDLNEKIGQSEIKNMIANVLHTHSGQNSVRIEIAPAVKKDVEDLLQSHMDSHQSGREKQPLYKIIEKEDMKEGECRMLWDEGGAIRSPDRITEEIRKEFKKLLPSQPQKEQENLPAEKNSGINKEINAESPDIEPDGEKDE
ncbi:MAG: hypothetical protein H6853_05160 [Rhodospirillales bacterium]|nr:hypothetical protein [Alphaproteobacteria bacterium]USO02940.1 MAG: hypothetical protein H6853_05160 [Rhodospirillales bacterium]